ncbi:LLM class flavin-dependent oxidoreductase [Frondihabitans australicus]|uniref:FMN-dependent oxidoreductase (Nitrilotriacetate monooxygenase family) n=1 Tax=Frondihabitans australicus TaxID=386892 RepID=A0A495INC7_9MICO|nr:LLM class flavin-dependent oxidoreductase [Frondihabitans australicus]RKR76656.1 FMN-dependent oxidoreductase (nitrilotriacetate monooxygenase family) [Frondihabitans australicus]
MTDRQLHLGVILTGAGGPGRPKTWLYDDLPLDSSVNVDWYIELSQLAEKGKLDLVFIVDSQFITPNSPPHYLNRLEPFTLLAALAVSTKNIGLVGTATTSYNDPFNLARRFASLDNISHGRAGWNVVTSGDSGTAGNYGRDEHYDYDTRYGRAHEAIEVIQGLWDSYEDDAFPRDRATGQFFDPSKQHALNHEGTYFPKVVGPLNIQRSEQGWPVIFQAGDSDQGRDLGAALGEGIFTHGESFEKTKAFRTDLRSRAEAKGRDADSVIILPGVRFFIGDTDEEARALEQRANDMNWDFDRAQAEFGRAFGWHDFSQYDPEAPFPDVREIATLAWKTQADEVTDTALREGLTLRQTVERFAAPRRGHFVGTAQHVADLIEEWFTGEATDGFNIYVEQPAQFRRFVEEVVPILQQKGIFRTEYEASTLRGNLGLPIPANRYTAAREASREHAAIS